MHRGIGEAARPGFFRGGIDGADLQFFFHREMPADEEGNGGGFVFDARSLPNPGREEQFRSMTGKDAAVIDYLNREASVHQYLAHVLRWWMRA
jgi:RNase adaptor protein for sRNA GlmZ degradation